jgi:hypothetical protein
MCARRFLIAVFVLTLLAVAGGFALFQWGGSVLLRQATPKGHFEAAQAGGGPDYGQASSWIAHPGTGADPSHWLPDGMPAAGKGDAAVFFIHPTTYLTNDRWNAPLQPGGDTEGRTRLFVQSQASAFNAAGEIWAPRYRQAAYGAFLLKSEDAQQALDLAYGDVSAAFDRFVQEVGNRPIILAGHSQGALHLERLLREKVAGKPIASHTVAAYVVGWPISTASDLPQLGFPACVSPDQTRCILSWMSFGDPPNASLFDQWETTTGFTGQARRRKDALCVNPISGVQNGAAPPAANPGTLVPTGRFRSAQAVAGAVGAHCSDGLLIVDGKVPSLGPFVLPGNNYHAFDYALFWGAIRQDASRRMAAWNR